MTTVPLTSAINVGDASVSELTFRAPIIGAAVGGANRAAVESAMNDPECEERR